MPLLHRRDDVERLGGPRRPESSGRTAPRCRSAVTSAPIPGRVLRRHLRRRHHLGVTVLGERPTTIFAGGSSSGSISCWTAGIAGIPRSMVEDLGRRRVGQQEVDQLGRFRRSARRARGIDQYIDALFTICGDSPTRLRGQPEQLQIAPAGRDEGGDLGVELQVERRLVRGERVRVQRRRGVLHLQLPPAGSPWCPSAAWRTRSSSASVPWLTAVWPSVGQHLLPCAAGPRHRSRRHRCRRRPSRTTPFEPSFSVTSRPMAGQVVPGPGLVVRHRHPGLLQQLRD